MMKYTCDFNWDFEKDKPKHKSYIALDKVLSLLSHKKDTGEQRKLAKEKGILNCPCHCHKGYCLDCNNICYICYKNGKNGKHLGLKAGEEDED